MEYSIDRTNYRRQVREEENSENSPQVVFLILKRILIQSIAGVIVLATIYTIKVMDLQPALAWLEEEIHKEIPFEVACAEVKSSIEKLYHGALSHMEGEEEKTPTDQESIAPTFQNELTDSILAIHTEEPAKIEYEEAVEGINQMSEDAYFIKENYNLLYPIQGTVTSRFGVRNSENPIVTPYHSGIDLAANTGTKIKSALSGTVTTAATGEAYGKYIMIQTDDISIVYAHCSKINVKQGQKVKQGDTIGEVGSTGWATGPHLHFEIRYQDRLVNPANILNFGE